MSPAGGYPIEEFLEAITAQLDQTQDALRLKAVNRPLTFALKDFNVDLKVFVEMDQSGRVNFRPAAPNEEGASTVSIGFTTITRPAIEENTISMEMANAPTLDELGLAPEERRQLARVGVRNAAQLRNLEQNAGDEGLSRHTGVNLGRIRGALNLARPRLNEVVDPDAPAPPDRGSGIEPGTGSDAVPPRDPGAAMRPSPGGVGPRPPTDPGHAPDPQPSPVRDPGAEPRGPQPQPPHTPDGFPPWPLRPGPGIMQPALTPDPALFRPAHPQPGPTPAPGMSPEAPQTQPGPPTAFNPIRERLARRKLAVGPGARNIELKGANLIDAGRVPVARLDGQKLDLLAARPSAVSFALPEGWALGPGRLSVEMPDGAQEEFELDGGAGS